MFFAAIKKVVYKGMDRLKNDPAKIFVLGFGMLILMGAFMFMLPISTQDGKGLNFVDALFESTSAVCVTGLAVVDTGSTFTTFGQIVLLALIQLGGWGIMTSSILVFIVFGKKIGLKERLLLQDSLNLHSTQGVVRLVIKIITITLAFEFIATIVLTLNWMKEMPFSKALYYGFFHSISAFNNAGFGLEPDNITKWVGDPIVNIVITSLIIFGGLGFIVIMDIIEKKSFKKLTFHSKIVLILTLIFNVFATIFIFLLEYDNSGTLGPLSLGDKIWASYFQAIVPRTAGFNTLDYSQMNLSTLFLTMGLMFIGASPSSTGGGIKITTFALIIFSLLAVITNKEDVNLFKRRISWDLINKAMSIGVSSIIFISVIFFLLTIVQKGTMVELIFETISAFGTVGLSMGLTGKLTIAGKLLITTLMFIGRLGPLTIALALMMNNKKSKSSIKYVEDKILIG